jgi:hypothetical protein
LERWVGCSGNIYVRWCDASCRIVLSWEFVFIVVPWMIGCGGQSRNIFMLYSEGVPSKQYYHRSTGRSYVCERTILWLVAEVTRMAAVTRLSSYESKYTTFTHASLFCSSVIILFLKNETERCNVTYLKTNNQLCGRKLQLYLKNVCLGMCLLHG